MLSFIAVILQMNAPVRYKEQFRDGTVLLLTSFLSCLSLRWYMPENDCVSVSVYRVEKVTVNFLSKRIKTQIDVSWLS